MMNNPGFRLPPRRRDAHKGNFGRVLLIAGSVELSGAAVLATCACLRSGAGLVTTAAPGSVARQIASANPAAMSLLLPETISGRISLAAKRRLQEILPKFDAVAVGPGLGQSAGLVSLVTWLFRECPCPLVLDADALSALAMALAQGRLELDDSPGGARERTGVGAVAREPVTGVGRRPPGAASARTPTARILTPHCGEFSRLWLAYQSRLNHAAAGRVTTESVYQGMGWIGELTGSERQAVHFAEALDVLVILKGAGTLVTDGQRVARNSTGNPGMATGGSGDCLTGILAADLAQGTPPLAAARRSCYIHGRAGDLAAAVHGEHAMNASDLLDYLPEAWKTLETDHES